MSTTDTAKQIRADLKSKLGLNSRQVSVRKSSGGGAVYVTILTTAASLDEVEKIARAYESVRYCEYSGEILCGGNTFVRVEYDDAAIAPMVAEVRAAFEARGSIRGIEMWHTGDSEYYGASGIGVNVRCWGLDFMCRQVAERLLSGAGACVKHADCAEHVELGIACAEASKAVAA